VSRRPILTDDVADALAAGGTFEHADEWSRWDWLAWAAPWAFGSFLVAGPLVFIALRTFVP
jgi:hypothetical protein